MTTTAGPRALAADPAGPRTLREVAVLDAAIDTIVEVESAIRRLTAFRTVLVDAARRQVPAAEAELLRPASDAARGPGLSGAAQLAERAFVADLATAMQLPEVTARGLVEDARSLVHDLPATLEELGRGAISYRHAQVMVEHTADLDAPARSAVEAAVLPAASTATPSGLARRLRRTRERVHPESVAVRHRRAAADRCVRLDPAADGMSWLTAFLPGVAGHAIMDRLDHVAGLADSDRTRDQARADAFAALLLDDPAATAARALDAVTGSADSAGPVRRDQPAQPAAAVVAWDDAGDGRDDALRLAELARSLSPRVFVTVPVLTLLGQGDEPAELDGYGPIDADTARMLAAGAPSFTRLLTHPETGAVLSVGRHSYAVPADLRRHLAVRDETCRFPGCGRRAAGCDIDHVVAFTDGGSTHADNLIHLCRHHHRLKHETSWRVELVDGATTWTSPTGRTHTTTAVTTPTPTRGPAPPLPPRGGLDVDVGSAPDRPAIGPPPF